MDISKSECGNNLQQKDEDNGTSLQGQVPMASQETQDAENDAEPVIQDVTGVPAQIVDSENQIISESQKLVEDEMHFAPQPTSLSYENMEDIKKDMEEKQVRICRSIDEVRQLQEKQQIMAGQVSLKEQQEQMDREQAENEGKVEARTMKIPANIFEGINYVQDGGLDDDWFDYTAFNIVINWLELGIYGRLPDSKTDAPLQPNPKWDVILEFPDIISSEGRLRLHEISNFFSLGDHSAGRKGKNRHFVMYPKNLNVDKQLTEKARIERERAKLWEKYTQEDAIIGKPTRNPQNMREQIQLEVWEKKSGKKDPSIVHHVSPKLNGDLIGKEPDHEMLIKLITAKKLAMEDLKENITKKNERYKEELDKLKSNQKNLTEANIESGQIVESTSKPKKSDGQKVIQQKPQQEKPDEDQTMRTADQDDSDFDDMDEASKQEVYNEKQQIEKQLKADAKKIQEYHDDFQNTNLKTFEDKPDDIKDIFVDYITSSEAMISWNCPDSNNFVIDSFKIYISETDVESHNRQVQAPNMQQKMTLVEEIANDKKFCYKLKGLKSRSAYLVKVTAVNKIGEGYHPKQLQMILTQSDNFDSQKKLYVWGSNKVSELGLTQEHVNSNNTNYLRTQKDAYLTKPIFQDSFQQLVHEVAQGAQTTLLHCHEKKPDGSEITFILQMGFIKILKEEYEQSDANLLDEDKLYMGEDISSLPFEINFNIPVIKVGCGDTYSALLTAEGQVYTWGSNQFGELGIDDERALYQINPDPKNPVKFKITNNTEKKVQILDIACGSLNMTAISDDFQIYVWGFRMGIYPSIELTLNFLEQNGARYSYQEINQAIPRLIKNNLVFHKIERIHSAYKNVALITQEGNLLLQGFNEAYQLCLRKEIRDMVEFFPDFMPIDALQDYCVDDISIGQTIIYTMCTHKQTSEKAVFAWGSNQNGQLFNLPKEQCCMPQNILPQITEAIADADDSLDKIAIGSDHTLFKTRKGKVLGVGKMTRGQLGCKQTTAQNGEKQKFLDRPVLINLDGKKAVDISCGTKSSMALVVDN